MRRLRRDGTSRRVMSKCEENKNKSKKKERSTRRRSTRRRGRKKRRSSRRLQTKRTLLLLTAINKTTHGPPLLWIPPQHLSISNWTPHHDDCPITDQHHRRHQAIHRTNPVQKTHQPSNKQSLSGSCHDVTTGSPESLWSSLVSDLVPGPACPTITMTTPRIR